jgi:hypothetical protein
LKNFIKEKSMSNFTLWLRKYTGSIISALGFIILAILTYGDLGELFTEQYWQNVGGNISSIGALSIGLVMIQVSIKQGISEQALSVGLNTKNTQDKYIEHRDILKRNQARNIYLSYFLAMRNERETKLRKREFLSDNSFSSEHALMISGNKRLIRKYKSIKVNITVDSIKWSTTDIVYQKNGRIEKLEAYRKRRAIKGLVSGIILMFATTLITGGMFLDMNEIPFWQKTVKLITYAFVIGMTAILDIGKNYEKGAFGVPNELDEINNIWKEFELWEIPTWVIEEVERNQQQDTMLVLEEKVEDTAENEVEEKGEEYEREETTDSGTVIQEEPEKVEDI